MCTVELQDGVILLVSLLQKHDGCLVVCGKLFQDVELGGGKVFDVELYDGKAFGRQVHPSWEGRVLPRTLGSLRSV